MKAKFWFLGISAGLLLGCEKGDELKKADDTFTGNAVTYALQSASDWNIGGVVTIQEKKDGYSQVTVKFNAPSDEALQHPVHLHFGDIATEKAEIAALLQPVVGKTGVSTSTLQQLADESFIPYKQLITLDACIKVHLSASGAQQDVVLAACNIGTASKANPEGRTVVARCKSK